MSVDPLADKYPNISSYAYCSNNPVNRIDPDGKRAVRPSTARPVNNRGNSRGVTNRNALFPNGQLPNSYIISTSYRLKNNGVLREQMSNVNPSSPTNPAYIETVQTAGGNNVQMTPNNFLGSLMTATVEFAKDFKQMKGVLFEVNTRVSYTNYGIHKETNIVIIDLTLRALQAQYEAKVKSIEKELGPLEWDPNVSGDFIQKVAERAKIIEEKLGKSPIQQIREELIKNPGNFEQEKTQTYIIPEFRQANN